MKSEGSNAAYRWCKRRGLEQQRFYEITKLREQFQEILQVHCLNICTGVYQFELREREIFYLICSSFSLPAHSPM